MTSCDGREVDAFVVNAAIDFHPHRKLLRCVSPNVRLTLLLLKAFSPIPRALTITQGKPSETRFEVLGRSRTQSMTLLRALPKTGRLSLSPPLQLHFTSDPLASSSTHLVRLHDRTHQIRIHAMHAGLPIVGDNVYGKEAELYTASDEELKESR